MGELVTTSAEDSVYSYGAINWETGQGEGTNQAPQPGTQMEVQWTITESADGSLTLETPDVEITGEATDSGAVFDQTFGIDLAAYGSSGYYMYITVHVECFLKAGGMYGTEEIQYSTDIASSGSTIPNGMEAWTFEAATI